MAVSIRAHFILHSCLLALCHATGLMAAVDEMDGVWVPLPDGVTMVDPAFPGGPVEDFPVHQILDGDEIPIGYAFTVDAEVCQDGDCRSANGTLFFNLAGKYRHFVPDPLLPLCKRGHSPFTAADYKRLDEILRDPNSLLGYGGLSYLSLPGGQDPAPDGISAATPRTLQRAAVDDAIWTTWGLWNYANGDLSEQLRELTRNRSTPDILKGMLTRQDLYENAYALYLLNALHPGDRQFLEPVIGALEQGDFNSIRLAMDFLKIAVPDRNHLDLRLAGSCSRMNPGYVPMVVKYIAGNPSLSSETLDCLASVLDGLPYFPVCSILDLLEERHFLSPMVELHVRRLLDSDCQQGDGIP